MEGLLLFWILIATSSVSCSFTFNVHFFFSFPFLCNTFLFLYLFLFSRDRHRSNQVIAMCDNTNTTTQSIADYLSQLLKDRKQLAAFPNVFIHVERLLDEEIAKVRASLFQISGVKKEPLVLPEPEGEVTTLMEKVYVPVKEHPDFNFVGRILGPRGMTAKQLEQETGCKIMVRGKGSMRDKKKLHMINEKKCYRRVKPR